MEGSRVILTARNALDRLGADGIAVSARVDKRQRAWRSPDILSLFGDFAVAAGLRPTGD